MLNKYGQTPLDVAIQETNAVANKQFGSGKKLDDEIGTIYKLANANDKT